MRIIYDSRHIKHIYSGLSRYTFSLLDALLHSDLWTELVILLDKNEDYSRNPMYKQICTLVENCKNNVRFSFLDAPLFGLKHHINVSQYVNTAEADLYFYPHFDLPVLNSKKSIFVVHDILPIKIDTYLLKHKFIKRFYFKKAIKSALKKENVRCIAVSESTKDDLLQYWGSKYKKKIKVVYENISDFSSGDSSCINCRDLPNRYLLYVGDRRPHKNLKKMIDIFVLLKEKFNYDGSFIIAGSGKNFDFDLETYVKEKPFIKILTNLSDEELKLLYSEMDSLLFLSKYEGFGIPILEAAEYDKKIITSNRSSMAEISPRSALLLDPFEDEFALAKKISRYVNEDISIDNNDYIKQFSAEKVVKEVFNGWET